jgi:aerobic-type carbon monoxide dehydrogenase small subunit (CoxS/CutS family)
MSSVTLLVNGAGRRVEADGTTSLLNVLRTDLGLTGSKYGCGEGVCGACTVLIDGRAVKSCITHVRTLEGRAITTIEGLERDGRLHPVQEAVLAHEALQCGYCTPGMIMAAVGLLAERPQPTDAEIVRGMDGNICRCGVYARIVAAIRAAAVAGSRAAR